MVLARLPIEEWKMCPCGHLLSISHKTYVWRFIQAMVLKKLCVKVFCLSIIYSFAPSRVPWRCETAGGRVQGQLQGEREGWFGEPGSVPLQTCRCLCQAGGDFVQEMGGATEGQFHRFIDQTGSSIFYFFMAQHSGCETASVNCS